MTETIHKTVRALDKAIDAILVLICALILFISVYSLLDNLWQVQGALDDSLLVYKPTLDEPLDHSRLISENQVAWLCLYDTDIDYPVMQGKDNHEYLNKDPYGEFRLSGSIFLDYRNDKNLTDEYSVIYGHHMDHGAMFGSLDDFKDEAYFDRHKSGRIVTRTTVYDYELFAVAEADAGNMTIFSPRGRTTSEILEYLNENSLIYKEHDTEGRIVALSTCSGDNSMTRLLVFGTIKEREGEISNMAIENAAALNASVPSDMSGYAGLEGYNKPLRFRNTTVKQAAKDMDDGKTFVLFCSFADCPYCNRLIPYLADAANDLDIDIDYLDTRSNPAWKSNLDIDDYDIFTERFGEYLTPDDDGTPHLYTPHIFVIRKGAVAWEHQGVIDGADDPDVALNRSQEQSLIFLLREGLSHAKQ